MTSPYLPEDEMESRATRQRERLHESVAELRTTVQQRLDPRRAAQGHVWGASALAAFLALLAGYRVGGMIDR